MSLRDHLKLKGVTLSRTTVTIDSYGNPTETHSSQAIKKAAIWSSSSNDMRISDKIAKSSSHILVVEFGACDFGDSNGTITYGDETFRLIGIPDNVGYEGVLVVHGMERIS